MNVIYDIYIRSARKKEGNKVTLGVIGEKLGMTQIFDANGLVVPVTVKTSITHDRIPRPYSHKYQK